MSFKENKMKEIYDSQKDTFEHISKVRIYISKINDELTDRALKHDHDKIDNPIEKALFDEYTPKLKNCTYGSEEYKKFLNGLKEAAFQSQIISIKSTRFISLIPFSKCSG